MAETQKFLDYNGLKSYDSALKDYIKNITGTDYKIGQDAVNIKQYIDSRIYVGTAAEADVAQLAGKIDDTTFKVIIDEDAEELTAITSAEITSLF